ncbi:hypothetical protein HPB51_016801 [Rhipicephalus microplus]|uniref:Uncharacterized protein n=1 Tax=Rhipicephalus microplus TaxID=6941 RepID=A0A9J6DIQ5_RHIMP|nr:hypothetical protein HPB51_016801 [Rhipicephalus microplus]
MVCVLIRGVATVTRHNIQGRSGGAGQRPLRIHRWRWLSVRRGGEAGDCQQCAILFLVPICHEATCPPANNHVTGRGRSPQSGCLGSPSLSPRHHPSPSCGHLGGLNQQLRHRHQAPKRQGEAWPHGRGRRDRRCHAIVSDRPWKAQWRILRNFPLDGIPWPFGGCTLADIEKAGRGAQLPTDAAVEFCTMCRVTVHYQCHYKGAKHVARTKATAEEMATMGSKAPEPAPLSQRSDTDLVALCRQRMGEDPHFAALLSGLPLPSTSDEPPMDDVATMKVDTLIEL